MRKLVNKNGIRFLGAFAPKRVKEVKEIKGAKISAPLAEKLKDALRASAAERKAARKAAIAAKMAAAAAKRAEMSAQSAINGSRLLKLVGDMIPTKGVSIEAPKSSKREVAENAKAIFAAAFIAGVAASEDEDKNKEEQIKETLENTSRIELVKSRVSKDLRSKSAKDFLKACSIKSFKELDSVDADVFVKALIGVQDLNEDTKVLDFVSNKLEPTVLQTFDAFIDGSFRFKEIVKGAVIDKIAVPVKQNKSAKYIQSLNIRDDIAELFTFVISILLEKEEAQEISLRSEFMSYFIGAYSVPNNPSVWTDKAHMENLIDAGLTLFELFKQVRWYGLDGKDKGSIIFTNTKNIGVKTINISSLNKSFVNEFVKHPAFKGKLESFFTIEKRSAFTEKPVKLIKVDSEGKTIDLDPENRRVWQGSMWKFKPSLNIGGKIFLHNLNQTKYSFVDGLAESREIRDMVLKHTEFHSHANNPVLKSTGELVYLDKECKEVRVTLQDAQKAHANALEDIRRVNEIFEKQGYFFTQFKFGPDNLRVYAKGGAYLALQTGFRNHLFGSAEPRVLSQKSVEILGNIISDYEKELNEVEFKIKQLQKEAITKAQQHSIWENQKEELELKILIAIHKHSMWKAIKGQPTNILVEIDQQASGTAMQVCSLGIKSGMKWSSLNVDFATQDKPYDIYTAMGQGMKWSVNGVNIDDNQCLSINQEIGVRKTGKAPYTPFQYGSGRVRFVKIGRKLLESIGLDKEIIEVSEPRWDSWTAKFKELMPEAAALRDFFTKMTKHINKAVFTYAASDGMIAAVTGVTQTGHEDIQNIKTTVTGRKVEFFMKRVSSEYFGVRHIAAYSHGLDSYVLRTAINQYMVESSFASMIPIHDAFMVSPEDIDMFWNSYKSALGKVVKNGKEFLKGYIKALYKSTSLWTTEQEVDLFVEMMVNELHKGDIKPEDIKGGLFIG